MIIRVFQFLALLFCFACILRTNDLHELFFGAFCHACFFIGGLLYARADERHASGADSYFLTPKQLTEGLYYERHV